ncbi:hypothetical protein IWQ55_001350 [Labrenzia sp. EL_208]|nr:hypothetical protein [Labrenzia sp. EL_132]MBG6228152.1 hypothetical protein [Labrenzia sp. EL_208]
MDCNCYAVITAAWIACAALLIPVHAHGENEQANEAQRLERLFSSPSQGLSEALETIQFEETVFSAGTDPLGAEVPLEIYENSKKGEWAATNVLHLKLDPKLSRDEIADIFEQYGFDYEGAYPGLGVLSVRAPDAYSNGEKLDTNGWLAATAAVIQRYSDDARILSVSPEILVDPQDGALVDSQGLATLGQAASVSSPTTEETDWGLGDIQAPALWPLLPTPVQRIVAVFDVGFALHEDILFVDGIEGQRVLDHGNHVAGIVCAMHNDRGYRGVLPYCGVRARAHGFWIDPGLPGRGAERLRLMRAVMETFEDFVQNTREVAAYNVSLGYNWHKLAATDPSFEFHGNPNLELLVENNAQMLIEVLKTANDRGVLIVSAAGNDSSGLAAPLDAQWASPFNYVARFACQARGLCNGVVVEAHDPAGDRAVFSNVGGHISCPGVNIHSAVATNGGKPSKRSYGIMSGTSMAAPYCTGGLVLLATLLPTLGIEEILECLRQVGPVSSAGTPMMRLADAHDHCR